jgi:hypothetical protein
MQADFLSKARPPPKQRLLASGADDGRNIACRDDGRAASGQANVNRAYRVETSAISHIAEHVLSGGIGNGR